MSSTYTGAPSANDVDWVRLVVGDTGRDNARMVLTDTEIQVFLDGASNRHLAAADAADALAAQFSRDVNLNQKSGSASRSQRAAQLIALADRLRRKGTSTISASFGSAKAEWHQGKLDEPGDPRAEEDRSWS